MKNKKSLSDFLKEGWSVEEDVNGINFYGIGFVKAPSGICYSDRIYFGELDEGYDEWNEECQSAQDFAGRVVDYINNGGAITKLHNLCLKNKTTKNFGRLFER